jgi:glycosyltransferase involved in cell wall biosynthesis
MPGWHRIYTRRVMARVVDSADRIIAVSADTANDLNVLLRVRPDRIRVVHNGVDAMFFGDAPSTRINERYVLFVGTPEPRKNLKRLAEAVGLLRSRGDRLSLVVAGAGGWGEGLAQGEGIEHVGRVSDSELHGLYANAACLAIPSLHEGFGLPALEAMAAGTPVVAADVGALPEVTGGAAILVDPENSTAIADGIERAISDRGRLVALGRAQARRFTWEITAALTAAVYREIA